METSSSSPSRRDRAKRVARGEDGRFLIEAPAKLNLGLRVFPVRPDGFHELETWMVPLSWHDTIWITPGGPLQLIVSGRTQGVPTELDKNLVGRAALKLAAAARVEPTGTIQLHKVLPPGGGLGGGSSDAASVLVALNEAWGLAWDEPALTTVAAELGSDVPFFIAASQSFCTGRGEIMAPLRATHLMLAVLIVPEQGCPTKDVFQAFDAGHRHPPGERTDWRQCAAARAEQLNDLLINDLEPAAYRAAPWLAKLRKQAAQAAGQPVHLTGSGSTLFTLCSSSLRATELQAALSSTLAPTTAIIPAQILRQG